MGLLGESKTKKGVNGWDPVEKGVNVAKHPRHQIFSEFPLRV